MVKGWEAAVGSRGPAFQCLREVGVDTGKRLRRVYVWFSCPGALGLLVMTYIKQQATAPGAMLPAAAEVAPQDAPPNPLCTGGSMHNVLSHHTFFHVTGARKKCGDGTQSTSNTQITLLAE